MLGNGGCVNRRGQNVQIWHSAGNSTSWKEPLRPCIKKYKMIHYLLATAVIAIAVICEQRPQTTSRKLHSANGWSWMQWIEIQVILCNRKEKNSLLEKKRRALIKGPRNDHEQQTGWKQIVQLAYAHIPTVCMRGWWWKQSVGWAEVGLPRSDERPNFGRYIKLIVWVSLVTWC